MTILATPAKRIGLILGLSLALLASLVLGPARAGAAPAPMSHTTMATNMLHAMNSERAAHHLPALRMNTRLTLSAHRHNLAMAKTNTMSHQLPVSYTHL